MTRKKKLRKLTPEEKDLYDMKGRERQAESDVALMKARPGGIRGTGAEPGRTELDALRAEPVPQPVAEPEKLIPHVAKKPPPAERDLSINMWRDDDVKPDRVTLLLQAQYEYAKMDRYKVGLAFGTTGGRKGPCLIVAAKPVGGVAEERYVVEVFDIVRLIIANRDQMPAPKKPKSRIILPGG